MNGYSFYFDELQTDAKRVLLLDSELRRAIENREFELYFQPKISVENEGIQGLGGDWYVGIAKGLALYHQRSLYLMLRIRD